MRKNLNKVLILGSMLALQLVPVTYVSANSLDINSVTLNSAQDVPAKEQIPMLKSSTQISKNQIEITYDKDVDATKGMTPTNYWIQSVTDSKPTGIASLGKDDKVNKSNSLTKDMVGIKAKDSSKNTFILTFKNDIPSGMKYKLIVCYVTVPNGAAYTGDNGTAIFVGK